MSNKPTLYAYAVKDRGRKQKAIWTRIGAAWMHEKGTGFTIELEAFPVNGRIVLTEPKSDDKTHGSVDAESTDNRARFHPLPLRFGIKGTPSSS